MKDSEDFESEELGILDDSEKFLAYSLSGTLLLSIILCFVVFKSFKTTETTVRAINGSAIEVSFNGEIKQATFDDQSLLGIKEGDKVNFKCLFGYFHPSLCYIKK